MRVITILNRDGGTLKTSDLNDLEQLIRLEFAAAGHSIAVRNCAGAELTAQLRAAFKDDSCDCVLVGGGDGSISAGAAMAFETGKTLGVLPAGTMNFFARSLGIPLAVDQAVAALATGKVVAVDIATANGRPFIHQFAAGLQPRMVAERERQAYRSRLQKIFASAYALLRQLRRPPALRVTISADESIIPARVSVLSITNNPFGEGHLPYANSVDSGLLGVYFSHARSSAATAQLAADIALGTWRNNSDVVEQTATRSTATFARLSRRAKATIDGELVPLEKVVEFEIHPRALHVIAPMT
jgi:diacylglycerol kinase family enzyme